MAQLQWQTGATDKAVSTYRDAIAIWKEVGNTKAEANALIELGEVLTEAGKFQEALEDLDRALQVAAGDALLTSSAHNGRGAAYVGLGDYARAFEEIQASLELTPANAWTYYNRARLHDSMGQHERAVDDYRAALDQRDPPLSPRLRLRAEEGAG